MTALDLLAIRAAKVTYDNARRRHERNALIDARANRPLMSVKEAAAAKRLARYSPGELLVIREIA